MTRMLSLDTSTTATGVAVWNNGNLAQHFIVSTSKKSTNKTHEMILLLTDILKWYNPDIVICEELNVINNVATAKKLSSVIGAIEGISVFIGAHFDTLPPSVWRKQISDAGHMPPKHRNDLKKWDIEQTIRLFNIIPEDDNEADAILVGEAYKRICNKGEVI